MRNQLNNARKEVTKGLQFCYRMNQMKSLSDLQEITILQTELEKQLDDIEESLTHRKFTYQGIEITNCEFDELMQSKVNPKEYYGDVIKAANDFYSSGKYNEMKNRIEQWGKIDDCIRVYDATGMNDVCLSLEVVSKSCHEPFTINLPNAIVTIEGLEWFDFITIVSGDDIFQSDTADVEKALEWIRERL